METDALIQSLARDPEVKRPPMKVALALCVAGALAYCVLAILILAGPRPDFGAGAPWVAGKAGLSFLFALAAAPLVLRLAKPGRSAGVWLPFVGALLALCAVAMAGGLATAPDGGRITALTGGAFPICAVVIPVVALPAGAGLFVWMRMQAPTRPILAGAAAGLLSGALSAMAYALTCPVDSVAFVAAWYPIAIAICAGLGAAAGSLALRW